MIYKYLNGMFLYQLHPDFFYVRLDVVTWMFMQTGLHKWLLNNNSGCALFDILFYSAPLILFLVYIKRNQLTKYAAVYMLIINFIYVQCYTLYPANSIEAYVSWLLFPVVFIPDDEKTVELLFDGLRYFFIFFFASSGVWKLAQGGLFNVSQMSGLLLNQHKEMLINSKVFWQSKFIMWLIQRPQISYLFYLSSALLQLSFLVGFFTKRLDKYLAIAFILFLMMDYLLMHISYFEVSAFLLTLLISRNKS